MVIPCRNTSLGTELNFCIELKWNKDSVRCHDSRDWVPLLGMKDLVSFKIVLFIKFEVEILYAPECWRVDGVLYWLLESRGLWTWLNQLKLASIHLTKDRLLGFQGLWAWLEIAWEPFQINNAEPNDWSIT